MCVCWMLKHCGEKLSKGFCSGQMLPLITAEQPLKKEAWECCECRWRPIRYPCKRFLKIFFPILVVHSDCIRFGGIIICHCFNLRIEIQFKGIYVALFPSQEHLHLSAANSSFLISKLGTVIQETMAAAPQHCEFNAASVSRKSSIICLRLTKFNNSV